MTSEERDTLKERILSQIKDLTAEIQSHQEASKPVAPDNAIGRLTRMEAITARGISEERLGSARLRLTRLQNTLKRMDTPQFGLCTICEDPIPLKRLLLMPETTRCVDCMKD